MKDSKSITRREFMGRSALAAAGLMIIPRHVLGGRGYLAPSDTVNIGCVGAWGRGADDIAGVSAENIIAICEVDDEMLARLLKRQENTPEQQAKYEKANKYRDFRVMLDKEKSLDAVVVAVPDHSHAVIAMAAMKRGKHVYCEKPLTHTVKEARLMAETAKKMNVVTQMGNQGHAKEGARILNEWIWDGALGPVQEVHVWTNRPIWPQGIEAPSEIPSCPPSIDWDVWLGPAPRRAYHPAYHPFAWRGWWDFGTGAVGDMGAHLIDQPFWALNLGAPKSVQASSTKFNKDSYPLAEIVTYEFPSRGNQPPCRLIWYDGGLTPVRPMGLDSGRMMGDDGGGCLFVGKTGSLLCGTYGQNPRLLPEKLMQEYKRPEKTIPRSPGIHEEWIAAIKAGKKSTTDFSYSGPLTELMLLGNVAIKAQEQKIVLEWDPVKMEFPNYPEANQYLHFEYRQGWSL
jgi:predicted dehydrogenase